MSGSVLRMMPRIGIAIGMLISAITGALAQSSTAKDPWPELASNIFNGRPIADGTSMLAIEMPGRAEDAAIVPLTLRVTPAMEAGVPDHVWSPPKIAASRRLPS